MTSVGWLAPPARMITRPIALRWFRVRLEGTENVPKTGAAIISANHLSFFDTPLLMLSAPRRVLFLGKAEYMDSWKTRYAFPAFGMVPIRRDKAKASMAALETAADLLSGGELVGIYPEGTRTRDGYLHSGHTGVAHLALGTGAPIVPVGIIGTDVAQPIGQRLPRRAGEIVIRFGEPIDPARYMSGGKRRRRQHITSDVMASIAAMTPQQLSPDLAANEPPLLRGGSESVYRVTRHRAEASSWAAASDAIVKTVCSRYDDGRVGEVEGLSCEVADDGSVVFIADLAVSSRFSATSPVPEGTHE